MGLNDPHKTEDTMMIHTNKPGWSHAWVLHGPEGSAVVSLKTEDTAFSCLCSGTSERERENYALWDMICVWVIGPCGSAT